MIRIAICEDHRVLADAMSMLLETTGEFELVAPPVTTGEEIADIVEKEKPDLVLMDITLGGGIDGIEATRRVKLASPDTQVVILSGQTEDRYLLKAVEAGASGFLTKGEEVNRVVDCMRAVARGEMLISSSKLARLVRAAASSPLDRPKGFEGLTTREKEILQLMAQGHGNERIAESLTISPHTVQTHVRNLLGKLGVHSRLEAVTLAARQGIVSL